MHTPPQKPREPRSAAACSAALLALSVAVCLGGVAAGPGALALPGAAAPAERRLADEHEQMVVAIIACLNDVAKQLAGSTALVVEDQGPVLSPPPRISVLIGSPGDAPAVPRLPHVSLLNLPPPTTLG